MIITGCVSTPPAPESDLSRWTERKVTIAAYNSWYMEAKVGVQTDQEASSFNVTWSQDDQSFNIRLFGPMGQGAVVIAGDNNLVTLTKGKEISKHVSLEELIYQHSDLLLPLSELTYWIRGLSAPGMIKNMKSDATGQPLQFMQRGWTVSYDRYQAILPGLPEKIRITNGKISARIIVKHWNLES